jgi:hypothetical protein
MRHQRLGLLGGVDCVRGRAATNADVHPETKRLPQILDNRRPSPQLDDVHQCQTHAPQEALSLFPGIRVWNNPPTFPEGGA